MFQLRLWRVPIDERLVTFLLFIAVSVVYFFLMPQAGDFHWSESPRNALDGAFVLDLVKDLPFADPKGWAYDYYLKYPAVTILFYPPLVHVELALVFAVFGVSHVAAGGLMAAHAGLLAAGVYRISRRLTGPGWSVMVATVTVFSPEMLHWGRQILLEMPMVSLLVWSGYFWLRFLEHGRRGQLVAAALLFLLAIYTKQTAIFMALAFIASLLLARGKAALSDRAIWAASLLFSCRLDSVADCSVEIRAVQPGVRDDHPGTGCRALVHRQSHTFTPRRHTWGCPRWWPLWRRSALPRRCLSRGADLCGATTSLISSYWLGRCPHTAC